MIFWNFRKPEAYGQTVLPDKSLWIWQKLVVNAKIQKFKCDILGNFQTLCFQSNCSQNTLFFKEMGNYFWIFYSFMKTVLESKVKLDDALETLWFDLYLFWKVPSATTATICLDNDAPEPGKFFSLVYQDDSELLTFQLALRWPPASSRVT